MKNRIMGELKKVFRPEFINRIDEVIVFHKLTKEEIDVVDLLLRRIRESLAERELSLNLSDSAADFLVDKGWDPAMGARPLRRAIQPPSRIRFGRGALAVDAARLDHGVDKAPEGDEDEVKISVSTPKERKRETVGVGAKGDAREENSSTDPSSGCGPRRPPGRAGGAAGRAGRTTAARGQDERTDEVHEAPLRRASFR